jgi:membrane dipeptidase
MQVCAIYTDVKPGSRDLATKQAFKFREMLMTHSKDVVQADADFLNDMTLQSKIGLVAAIENAAGLAEEKEPIQEAFQQLDHLIKLTGRMAYISLTHHTENRFGGGNYTEGVGLKEDGKKLLDYISGKKIAIDLSHTSDLLAEGILNHIDSNNNCTSLSLPAIPISGAFGIIRETSPMNLPKRWSKEEGLSE